MLTKAERKVSRTRMHKEPAPKQQAVWWHFPSAYDHFLALCWILFTEKFSSPSSIPWIAYQESFREQMRTSNENVRTLMLVSPLPQLASLSRGPSVLVSDRLMSQIKSQCLWLFYSSVFSLRRIHGRPLWIRNKDKTDYTNLSLTYTSHHHGEKTDILNDPQVQCGEGCPKLFVLCSQCPGEVEGSFDANTSEGITVFE